MFPLIVRAISECLKDTSCGGAIQIDYFLYFLFVWNWVPTYVNPAL